jgi:hypothetical protein
MAFANSRTYTRPKCRRCGCTDVAACIGRDNRPCHWIEPNLCSNCLTRIERKRLAAGEHYPSRGRR